MFIKIDRNPSNKTIREFAWVFWAGWAVFASIAFWRGKHALAEILLIVGSGIGIWSLLFPRLGKPFYWTWMGLAFVMGSIVSRIIITAVFFLIITPVSIVFKLLRRDALQVHRKRSESYWVALEKVENKDSYTHLF